MSKLLFRTRTSRENNIRTLHEARQSRDADMSEASGDLITDTVLRKLVPNRRRRESSLQGSG